MRKAHIEVEGRLMGHILTEFLQQTSHCCFRGHSCFSREIIFANIDKVVQYEEYFGMFFEFYSSSAKESKILVEIIQSFAKLVMILALLKVTKDSGWMFELL